MSYFQKKAMKKIIIVMLVLFPCFMLIGLDKKITKEIN